MLHLERFYSNMVHVLRGQGWGHMSSMKNDSTLDTSQNCCEVLRTCAKKMGKKEGKNKNKMKNNML